MSITQYLTNATDMLRNWSRDRMSEKPFFETPKIYAKMYNLAWDFLYKCKPVIKKSNHLYLLTKQEHSSLINLQIAKSNFDKLDISFNNFV